MPAEAKGSSVSDDQRARLQVSLRLRSSNGRLDRMEDLIRNGNRILSSLNRVIGVARLRPFDTSSVEGRSKERYRRILLTTASSLATRGITSVVSLVTIPLALSYLGKEKYGLWAVITSLVAWTNLCDFGIVNSLVNALSEANGKNDTERAKSYVSTAFFALLAISTILGVVLALSAGWVPWSRVLAVRIPIAEQTVMWTVVAALVCVLAGLPLSIVRQIYAGYQKSYVGNLFTIFGALITLGSLYAVIWTRGGLPSLVLAFAGPGVLIAFVNLLYLTHLEMPWLAPRLNLVSRRAMRRLSSTSMPLFLFQIGALLVNETQMIVLAHVTSLKLVSEYSIIWRLGIALTSLVGMGTSAFVPAFREAHERGDSGWMKTAFRRMLLLRMSIAAIVFLALICFGNFALRTWLHRGDFSFPLSVWTATAISFAGTIWVTSFSDFLTIMDRIWIQVSLVLINGITTIALTILLAPRLGLLGAIVAIGFVTVCFWTWLIPLLVSRLFFFESSSNPDDSKIGEDAGGQGAET